MPKAISAWLSWYVAVSKLFEPFIKHKGFSILVILKANFEYKLPKLAIPFVTKELGIKPKSLPAEKDTNLEIIGVRNHAPKKLPNKVPSDQEKTILNLSLKPFFQS